MSAGPNLDFTRPGGRTGPISWLLLAIGLGVLAWTGLDYGRDREEFDRVQDRLARIQQTPARTARKPARPNAAETARRQAEAGVERQLGLSWTHLVEGLQQQRPAEIALLSLDADGRRMDFQLAGLARNHQSMLDYLRRVQSVPGLARVELTRHGTAEADGLQVVEFNLRGDWGKP